MPADIDKAVTLGLNYPNGPFKFADVLGVERMHQYSPPCIAFTPIRAIGPNIWLTRRAMLKVSALTNEP